MAVRKDFTGTRYGGEPPDSGHAYVNGERIAMLPVNLIKLTPTEFELLRAAHEEKGRMLTRQEARDAIGREETSE